MLPSRTNPRECCRTNTLSIPAGSTCDNAVQTDVNILVDSLNVVLAIQSIQTVVANILIQTLVVYNSNMLITDINCHVIDIPCNGVREGFEWTFRIAFITMI